MARIKWLKHKKNTCDKLRTHNCQDNDKKKVRFGSRVQKQDRQCTAVAKPVASGCACARVHLLIQHATRKRQILLSFVASLVPPHFSTISHKRRDFRKNVTEYKMCIFIFSTSFIWKISHSKNNSARCYYKCENVVMLSTSYFLEILTKLEISRYSFEKLIHQILSKSSSTSPVVPCERTDGRSDKQGTANPRFS